MNDGEYYQGRLTDDKETNAFNLKPFRLKIVHFKNGEDEITRNSGFKKNVTGRSIIPKAVRVFTTRVQGEKQQNNALEKVTCKLKAVK